jgi:excisionase family DNA binding protein
MLGAKDIFSIGEVAQLTGIPVKTVRGAILAGELVALRFNARLIRVRRGDMQQWLDRCMAAARVRVVRASQKQSTGTNSRNGRKSA